MKNKNKLTTEAILNYMTWSSPMNQAFIIEALGRDNIEFNYTGKETNVVKVKQAIKLFGVERVKNALMSYAIAVVNGQDELKKAMEHSFINVHSWIQCGIEAISALTPTNQINK